MNKLSKYRDQNGKFNLQFHLILSDKTNYTMFFSGVKIDLTQKIKSMFFNGVKIYLTQKIKSMFWSDFKPDQNDFKSKNLLTINLGLLQWRCSLFVANLRDIDQLIDHVNGKASYDLACNRIQ